MLQFYFYQIPRISKLIPNEGPMTGGTHIKVDGLNMHPLDTITKLNISKWSYYKFGHVLTPVIFHTKQESKTVSPSSPVAGKVLVQVNTQIL